MYVNILSGMFDQLAFKHKGYVVLLPCEHGA
jgi:hypothetical protein